MQPQPATPLLDPQQQLNLLLLQQLLPQAQQQQHQQQQQQQLPIQQQLLRLQTAGLLPQSSSAPVRSSNAPTTGIAQMSAGSNRILQTFSYYGQTVRVELAPSTSKQILSFQPLNIQMNVLEITDTEKLLVLQKVYFAWNIHLIDVMVC